MDDLEIIFGHFQNEITAEYELRDEIRVNVRDLEQVAREMLAILQRIHQANGLSHVNEICNKARDKVSQVQQLYKSLSDKVPANEYYKYHDFFRFVTQRFVFLVAFMHYVENENLIYKEKVAECLGLKSERLSGSLHLDLEDYLSGMLTLAGELSRLAVNCVTYGEYSKPVRIAQFLCDLDGGFRLLNFKNDMLRKRYDGLKYEVKKVEEVLYDLSVRGLITGNSSSTAST